MPYTDSRSANDCLQHGMPNGTYQLTSANTILQRILNQGKIIINWVLSHINVHGNELVDKLAEQGRGMPPTSMIVSPCQRILSHNATVLAILLRTHKENTTCPQLDATRMPQAFEKPLELPPKIKGIAGHTAQIKTRLPMLLGIWSTGNVTIAVSQIPPTYITCRIVNTQFLKQGPPTKQPGW